jgi:hypothetical protein
MVQSNLENTIEVTDENGNIYKFEKPDFICTLHFVADGEWIYGSINDDALNLNHTFMCAWNIHCGTAICVDGSHDFGIYKLTPIKVPTETDFKNDFDTIISVTPEQITELNKYFNDESYSEEYGTKHNEEYILIGIDNKVNDYLISFSNNHFELEWAYKNIPPFYFKSILELIED